MSLSPGSLFLALLISIVGYALFRYGRKMGRTPQLVTGLALMVYPYFVSSTAWMATVAAVILGGLWWSVRLGW